MLYSSSASDSRITFFTAFPDASERAPGSSGAGLIGFVDLLTIMFSFARVPMSVLMRRTASVHFRKPVDSDQILRISEEIGGEKVRRRSPLPVLHFELYGVHAT